MPYTCEHGNGTGMCLKYRAPCRLAHPFETHGDNRIVCTRDAKAVGILNTNPVIDLDQRAREQNYTAEELCGRFDLLHVDRGSIDRAMFDYFQNLYLKARSLVHDIPGATELEKNEIAIRMAKRALHRNLALAERKAIGEA